MRSIKKFLSIMVVIGIMMTTLVACDMESLMSDLLEDPDVQDEIRDVLENKTDEKDGEEETEDDEREESTTKRKWPFGEKQTEAKETIHIDEWYTEILTVPGYDEWYSEDYSKPIFEEWPNEPVGELEYTMKHSDNGEPYYIVSGIGSWRGKQLEIPAEYNGIPVKKIGYGAFMGAEGIRSVYIEEGIEEIEMWAFGSCQQLKDVGLPSSITYISSRVFSHSNNLSHFNFYNGNNRYSSADGSCIIDTDTATLHTVAGARWDMLNDILRSYDIEIIGEDACRGMEIDYVDIPENIREISYCAFFDCYNLQKVVMTDNLHYIASSAFANCNLHEIEWAYINDNPVYFCYESENCVISYEKELVLGTNKTLCVPDDGSVDRIGAHAFAGRRELYEIIIPEGVKIIGREAFSRCANLKVVKLPKGLEEIEYLAFEGCKNLREIEIPSYVKVDSEAFRGVPGFGDSYTKPEYDYATPDNDKIVIVKPDGSMSYEDYISGNGTVVEALQIVDVKVNPDGSYTVTLSNGKTYTYFPDDPDSSEGDFSFTTFPMEGSNIIFKP